MFRFLHAADIHLDSPLHKLDYYEGAPVDELRQATRRALNNLVQTAIRENVSFVLITETTKYILCLASQHIFTCLKPDTIPGCLAMTAQLLMNLLDKP